MFKSRIIAFLLVFLFSFSQVSATDIIIKSKYDGAVNYLNLINVIEDKKTFKPLQSVNKAEFIALTLKNAGFHADELKRTVFRTPFKDVPLDAWYTPYIYIAFENGLIPEDDYFFPSKSVTRFEALKFFFTLEGIAAPIYAKNLQSFNDVPKTSKAAPIIMKALELDLITPDTKDSFGLLQKITKGDVAIMLYEYALYETSLTISTDNNFSDEIPNSEVLVDAWNRIHDSYLFDEKIDDTKMINAAIEAMVESLDDPFSVYMPPEEGTDYASSLDGELDGIGAYIGYDDGKVIIVSPIQGSPAQAVGLEPNDEIINIDGENMIGQSLFEVVKKLKGPKDTQVTVTIKRGNQEKTFIITRAKIELKTVGLEMQNGIAVISLTQFLTNTPQEFDVVVDEALEKNAKGVVLDLRNNPGGLLGVSLKVLGHFVEKGEVVIKIDYPTVSFDEKTNGEAKLANLPVVVLMNKGSASASEIVAAALQELGIAKIVGQTSYGKGTVQELTYYTDGSNLKLTIAKWLTPKGNWINEIGIVPDFVVENNTENSTDYQMQKALDLVQY